MKSEDLTPAQARKLHDALAPTLGFLNKLERRLIELQFDPNDPLYGLVTEAYNSLHKLSVETHYLSCVSGVARRSRTD
jgi:hypothetical protein